MTGTRPVKEPRSSTSARLGHIWGCGWCGTEREIQAFQRKLVPCLVLFKPQLKPFGRSSAGIAGDGVSRKRNPDGCAEVSAAAAAVRVSAGSSAKWKPELWCTRAGRAGEGRALHRNPKFGWSRSCPQRKPEPSATGPFLRQSTGPLLPQPAQLQAAHQRRLSHRPTPLDSAWLTKSVGSPHSGHTVRGSIPSQRRKTKPEARRVAPPATSGSTITVIRGRERTCGVGAAHYLNAKEPIPGCPAS